MNTERFLVLTGAGISADSGIPTFRGPGGYWRNLDPMTLASPEGFAANPALVWEWYRERRAGIRAAQPNAAHVAVTRLALEAPECLLVTQNVDDLHRRAAHKGATLPDDRIVQIHGDIFIDRCERCDKWGRESFNEDTRSGVPLCDCGARLRPGVVWFGETIDTALLARVERFVSGGLHRDRGRHHGAVRLHRRLGGSRSARRQGDRGESGADAAVRGRSRSHPRAGSGIAAAADRSIAGEFIRPKEKRPVN
jgi:hypothetical protein